MGADIFVELNYGVVGSHLVLNDATLGLLDTGRLAAAGDDAGYWTDISTGYGSRVSIRRGRTRALEKFDAGRLTAVLDNADRRFDPTNTASPYIVGGVSAVQPMRGVRVRAEYAGVSYPLFSGFADAWDIGWSDPAVSDCTLTATDGFKVLADFDPLEVSPVGAGEDSGARVSRLLDNASWPAADRAIDTGDSTLQATNLSANTLSELILTADSERGQVFVNAEGNVTFKRRSARSEETVSITVQATFGDADDGVELPYADLTISYDDELIRNRASVARVGGTAQVVSDATSIARYLTHTFTRTDLLFETDDESLQYGTAIVRSWSSGELRFDRMVLEPDDDDRLWPYALGLDFGHRIKIRRRPPGGGSMIERECFIEGVTHDKTATGKWRTSFDLSQASATTGLVLDHATRGTLDTAANSLTY